MKCVICGTTIGTLETRTYIHVYRDNKHRRKLYACSVCGKHDGPFDRLIDSLPVDENGSPLDVSRAELEALILATDRKREDTMSDYQSQAESDAQDTVSEYREQILEQLLEGGEASDDLLNDYPSGDAYHHESHVDKWYNLTDAAELIDELSEFEETDSGLWEGQQPKEAIGTCAAFTYGNAVYSEWHDLIEKINEEAETVIDDYDDQIADAEKALEEAQEAEDNDDEDYEGPSVEDCEDLVSQLKAEKEVELGAVIDKAIAGEL